MKTLKELNSKWYWRLLKVIFTLSIIGIMFLCIYVYEGMKTYNPKVFKEFEEENREMYTKLKALKDKYPENLITQDKIKTEHSYASDLARLFAMGKEIEGQIVIGYTGDYDKEKCTEIFGKYITELNQRGRIEEFPIHSDAGCGTNDGKEFNDFFSKFELMFNKDTDLETKANIYTYIEDKYIYKDYLGFFGVVKSIFAILGLWLFTALCVFGIRCIMYYIIFGKIFPPK